MSAMKRVFAAVFLAGAAMGAHAQSITAGDLERQCTATDQAERTICVVVVKAFLDGYIEGNGSGVLGVYRHDPAVLASVKDVKMQDMSSRVSKVLERSTCVQRVSVAELANTYVDYMHGHAEARPGNYRTAMVKAIQAKYCER